MRMADDDQEVEQEEEPALESWVRIQQHTFTNWVNDKLRAQDLEVENLRTDFKDGIKLCKLIEVCRGQRIRGVKMKKKVNFYEARGNLQLAFDALANDRVRLVNIGGEDVRSGNIKLILGLIWTLIRRYQIGSQSKLPPKAMMLSWCNAVLSPHLTVTNFSTNWNNGIAIHGLLEYCRPGTCPHWYNISASDGVANCTHAMGLAMDLFEIPAVIRPEDMASPDVDELSGMTYLSYFMADDSPGYKATRNWVRNQINPVPVDNFDNDWNNGYILSSLVKSLGGNIPGWPEIQQDWEIANQIAIDTARTQLHIEPVLQSKDLINPDVDHIGVMAHVAWHEARTRESTMVTIQEEPQDSTVELEPEPQPGPGPISVEPPEKPVTVILKSNWRIDTNMTFDVDTSKIGRGDVTSDAEAPSESRLDLQVFKVTDNLHHIEFMPTEIGDWKIFVQYYGEDVRSSPYHVNVYDPSAARINRDYSIASSNEPYTFEVDVANVGIDDISIYVVHEGASISHDVIPLEDGRYQVSFRPVHQGSYTVAVYSGGAEIPGSPFDVVCKSIDGVYARGQGLTQAFVGNETEFEVDTSAAPDRTLVVTIRSPDGYEVPHELADEDEDQFGVIYKPEETGFHTINILYDGTPIEGSPFTVNVLKPRVSVYDLPKRAFIGQKTIFTIDASQAKKGTLEIDSDLPVLAYDKAGPNTYKVTFVPKKAGKHDMTIKYNNLEVEGCPYQIEVMKSNMKKTKR